MILLNGVKVEFEKFPNGETRVNGEQIVNMVRSNGHDLAITLKYETDNDLFHLMFLKKFIDDSFGPLYLSLRIMYMPYSRMDRVEGNSVFTLKYVADFINSLNFDRVFVYEPHSDVTPALLNKCMILNTTAEHLLPLVINDVKFDPKYDFLFFPDAGAQKRYGKIKDVKQLVGFKKRDFATGKILSLDVVGANESLAGSRVIILDDLCSFGGTFMMSGQKLKEMGAGEIYLVVTHCEQNILSGQVLNENSPVDKVFTTNTIFDESMTLSDKIKVYNIT